MDYDIISMETLDKLFNPAFGLPNSRRLSILHDAADKSVKEASAQSGISRTTIYGWRHRVRCYLIGLNEGK